MLDLNQDWRVARRNAEYYTDANRLLILTTLEHKYASNPFHGSGPYLLGEKISIADYFTFQTLNELPVAIRTEEEEQKFPELMKVWKAVAQRPGIKALLEEQKEGVEKLKVFLGLAGK